MVALRERSGRSAGHKVIRCQRRTEHLIVVWSYHYRYHFERVSYEISTAIIAQEIKR